MFDINVEFIKTGKPLNSTLVPAYDADTDTNLLCELHEPFDIYNPTIVIADEYRSHSKEPNLFKYNYCHIGDPLNRYYWISNWERRDGLWYAYCTGDYLASFRNDILKTTQYVLRTNNSDVWDNSITDSLYPTHEQQIYGYVNGTLFPNDSTISNLHYTTFSNNLADEYYNRHSWIVICQPTKIVNIHDEEVFNDYGCGMFVTTGDFARRLIQQCGKKLWTGQSLSTYIQTIMELPFDIVGESVTSAQIKSIEFGGADGITVNMNYPNNLGPYGLMNFFGPLHDSSRKMTVGKWNIDLSSVKSDIAYENSSSYLSLSLLMRPFGFIDIPAEFIQGLTSLTVMVQMDVTGYAELRIGGPAFNKSMTLGTAWLGKPARIFEGLQAWGYNLWNSIKTSVGAAAGVVTKGLVGNIQADALEQSARYNNPNDPAYIAQGVRKQTTADVIGSSISSGIGSITPPISLGGVSGGGGTAVVDDRPQLFYTRKPVVERYDYRFGRPACKVKKLSDLSGYFVLCKDAVFGGAGIGWNATNAERQAIEQALNGGVYLE